MVELALVLPLFLLILLGVFDFGRAIYAYNTLNNAAREAARVAIVDQNAFRVEEEAKQLAVAVPVTVEISYHLPAPNADPSTNPACDPTATDWAKVGLGCIAIITVRHDYQAVTPMIHTLVGAITLTGRTEMPVERAYISP